MPREIKKYNGRWHQIGKEQHIYIGAYSVADACRICTTLSGNDRGWRREIDVYFCKGCWGNSMKDVTVERGAWVSEGMFDKPVRVIDANGEKICE